MKNERRRREVIYHKSFDYHEAELWDIEQHIRMTPEERQSVAKELRRRVFGDNPQDVRESHTKAS